MTTAQTLLEKLTGVGVIVELASPDKLRIDAPPNTVSKEMREALAASKPELIELLTRKNQTVLSYEKNELNEKSPTKLFQTKIPRADRLYAFQMPADKSCFVCDKPVMNYYENCPHCGDFPAWF